MPSLYGYPTGNCMRAAIALAEAGVAFTPVRIDLRLGEQVAPAYLALNPEGKVPTLVDDAGGRRIVLSQSNAIILYAAESAPGTIVAAAGAERALAYQRYFYFVTEVLQNLLSTYLLRGPANAQAIAILAERAIAALAASEGFLRQSRFMAGDTFSIADIVALSVVPGFTAHLPWDSLPNLRRWFDDVCARPAVIRGLHAFDPVH